jgi:hypothetical protein
MRELGMSGLPAAFETGCINVLLARVSKLLTDARSSLKTEVCAEFSAGDSPDQSVNIALQCCS